MLQNCDSLRTKAQDLWKKSVSIECENLKCLYTRKHIMSCICKESVLWALSKHMVVGRILAWPREALAHTSRKRERVVRRDK